MIDLIFYHGTEIVFVRIQGYSVTFSTSSQSNYFADISGLRIDKEGVIKEFPDLEYRTDWKEISINRFKEHIKNLKNEEEVCSYVISELKKRGYVPKYKQKAGFRREKI